MFSFDVIVFSNSCIFTSASCSDFVSLSTSAFAVDKDAVKEEIVASRSLIALSLSVMTRSCSVVT